MREPIAVTFDDLPMFDQGLSGAAARKLTLKLLAQPQHAGIQATGFVNEGKMVGADRADQIAMLQAWLDAGMDLGNHGYAHLSYDKFAASEYIADAARGDTVTSALLRAHGRDEHWWRYPYLETGSTAEAKRAFEDWLGSGGYSIAPVTAENTDYLFADAYDAAIAHGNRAAAEHVAEEYLDYTARMVVWYRSAALALLGRRPALVLLLHASRLNADVMSKIVVVIRRADFRFVPLGQAMRDPAYRIPDEYVGPDGIEWLERWSISLHRDLPWGSLPTLPTDIVEPEQTPPKT